MYRKDGVSQPQHNGMAFCTVESPKTWVLLSGRGIAMKCVRKATFPCKAASKKKVPMIWLVCLWIGGYHLDQGKLSSCTVIFF